jgi:hypothetical protein
MKDGKPYNQPTLRAEETGDPQNGRQFSFAGGLPGPSLGSNRADL